MNSNNPIPSKGLKGLKENWRNDVSAALSVSLVALPLALGIAVASGVSPMAGVLSEVFLHKVIILQLLVVLLQHFFEEEIYLSMVQQRV